MKKFMIGLTAALVLVACAGGDSGVKTQDEIVSELISDYFGKKALDCSLANLSIIDTLYQPMPEEDSMFVALKGACDRAYYKVAVALDSRRDPSDTTWFKLFDAYNQAKSNLLQYYDEYQGEVLGYAYKCVVRSQIYELKKEVEGYIFVANPELTQVVACPGNFLKQLQMEKDTERSLLLSQPY